MNTPAKAWRQVFTSNLLNKIVAYTNEYGSEHAKEWVDIDRSDLTDFISVLFIAGIQKRKDPPTNWFSSCLVENNPVIQSIMSGKKFLTILRYLHVCSLEEQRKQDTSSANYDPIYKVKEMMDYLEERYKRLFVPGRNLSLDETLIRAFGRIKFKVRIITKSARYGIKLYVITDAVTAFVLKVIVYTGTHTYSEGSTSGKKTVDVVKALCEDYAGTHRSVFVDRFYTSIDLLRELESMDLYLTGTVMGNRIPKTLTIAKQSKDFKSMNRGDYCKHVYSYQNDKGELKSCGLVCWKDRNMVYCLTNEINTNDIGHCYRRSQNGRILMERPVAIECYNRYMGGVDLADMRRLHCNSTIMNQNRWWLKLFFYLLDVATSNALVLYKESTDEKNKDMNIVEFKKKLVYSFVGQKIGRIGDEPIQEPHKAERVEARLTCACCAFYGRSRRTRYRCSHPECGIPLCNLGSGKVGEDCFSICHADENIRMAIFRKFKAMKLKRNARCKLSD